MSRRNNRCIGKDYSLKISGCIIVTVLCTLLGAVFADREEKKLKILEEMYSLILKINAGIKNRIPFREIAAEYMSLYNPVYICGKDYTEIVGAFERIKSESICTNEAASCISALKILSAASDASETERIFTDISGQLKNALEKTRDEHTRKRGLYIKLGAVLGLLVCIIVI